MIFLIAGRLRLVFLVESLLLPYFMSSFHRCHGFLLFCVLLGCCIDDILIV